jgi:hypothetical protein
MWAPFNWAVTKVLGVDLNEEQRRSDENRAFFEADNKRLYDSGAWTQTQYETAAGNVAGSYTHDVAGDVATAGVDSIKQTLDQGRLFNPILNPIKTLLKQIPWWIWLIGLGIVAWKLGLFGLAQRRIGKMS